MQVDGEILFTNKGPGMVKECKINSKLPVSRSISCDQGHLKVKTAQNRNYIT